MLDAAHLRARAAEYCAWARGAADARTRDQYLAVANYLAEWADQAEAKAGAPAPSDRKAG